MAKDDLPDGRQLQITVDHAAMMLGAKKVVVIAVVGNDGIHVMHSAGFSSHYEMTMSLGTAIHLNLLQHDQAILSGAAGSEAQALAERLTGVN